MLNAKAPNNIRVVDYAMTPTEPIDSKRLPYLGLAFLISLTAGVGLALFRDYFDDSVRTAEEVEETLRIPALAVIPKVGSGIVNYRRIKPVPEFNTISDSPGQLGLDANNTDLLLSDSDLTSPIAEAFRRLRTALLLSPAV